MSNIVFTKSLYMKKDKFTMIALQRQLKAELQEKMVPTSMKVSKSMLMTLQFPKLERKYSKKYCSGASK